MSETKESSKNSQQECPYLDTIDRSVLDFDFEPSCSISLESGPHVYGCLVCGKFFRGKGPHTPAYTHSVEEDHFLFVHLLKGSFHCLPDDYVVEDASLKDISAALHPTFTQEQIRTIDDNTGLARDLFGRRYLPGYVGLNNLNKTDYINATVQALAHVPPLRNFFLQRTHFDISIKSRKKNKPTMSPLAQAFGELVRKMWSDQRFKAHVDPHILIQCISTASNKKYRVGHQAEAGEFMAWFLHQLHVGLGGTRKPNSSIIHQIFQGRVQVTTRETKKRKRVESTKEEDDRGGSEDEMENQVMQEEEETVETEETTTTNHFLQLTLDIPEKPLFRDDEGGLVIPQEPLVSVLKKFDGVTFSNALNGQRRKYQLLELPNYLVLHLARFKSNRFTKEKNPTIVAFPVKNLDLTKYVFGGRETIPTKEQVKAMSVSELKALLVKHGRGDIAQNVVEKDELVKKTMEFVATTLPDLLADKYDLVANITHDSPAEVGREGQHDPLQEGSYKCHVQHRAARQWYEMQDLHVQETMPQLIGLSESYVLVFERKGVQSQSGTN